MQNMTVVRALTSLWSQRPSLPARSLIDRSRVDRRRHHGVPVTWIDGARAAQATIVHLHGGAYLHGERPAHWEWLEEITRRAGTAGAMVHYRMPPRFPFPAAYVDAMEAVRELVDSAVVRSGRWLLSGDSAGAARALAALGRQRRRAPPARGRLGPARPVHPPALPAPAHLPLGGPDRCPARGCGAAPGLPPLHRAGPRRGPADQPRARRPAGPPAGPPGRRRRGRHALRRAAPAAAPRGGRDRGREPRGPRPGPQLSDHRRRRSDPGRSSIADRRGAQGTANRPHRALTHARTNMSA